ncbi:MAG: outer membrane lipoprotein carrier protein LolA [Desulfocapsa sp.]|nr:outer membrane lipoprotein carrier protein LolA [Desulfocapsa sp.]
MKVITTTHFLQVFLFLPFLLFLFPLAASAEAPGAVATRLQKRYDNIQSLSFDFIQDTRGQLSGRPKKGRGQAFFVKEPSKEKLPGKMRWNYSDPDRQVLVSDGKTFSMYFASLAQMIVTPAESLQKELTYSFFTGSGNLFEDFRILAPDNGLEARQGQTSIIQLIPRAKQSQVASIHLWVTDDSLIQRIEILDQFDTLTVLNFSNLQVNTLDKDDDALMKRLFHFTPPEGTEIIYQ